MKRTYVIGVSLALGFYFLAYLLNVERGWPGSRTMESLEEQLPHPAQYKWNNRVSRRVFYPIHYVDRKARSSFWSPTVSESREIWEYETNSSNAEQVNPTTIPKNPKNQLD